MWVFHSEHCCLIRARKKYFIICTHCEKFIFSWVKLNGMKKLIFCLSIFNLKQDVQKKLSRRSEKSKSETDISAVYGIESVYSMACLFVLCIYLLAYFTYQSKAIGFFHKRFKFVPDFRSDVVYFSIFLVFWS